MEGVGVNVGGCVWGWGSGFEWECSEGRGC